MGQGLHGRGRREGAVAVPAEEQEAAARAGPLVGHRGIEPSVAVEVAAGHRGGAVAGGGAPRGREAEQPRARRRPALPGGAGGADGAGGAAAAAVGAVGLGVHAGGAAPRPAEGAGGRAAPRVADEPRVARDAAPSAVERVRACVGAGRGQAGAADLERRRADRDALGGRAGPPGEARVLAGAAVGVVGREGDAVVVAVDQAGRVTLAADGLAEAAVADRRGAAAVPAGAAVVGARERVHALAAAVAPALRAVQGAEAVRAESRSPGR